MIQHIFSDPIPLIIVLIIAFAVAAFLFVPNTVRERVFLFMHIGVKKAQNATTTSIERELKLIAGPQKIIQEASEKVQDLQGSLFHERNVLMLREDDLARAEETYYKAADEKADQTAIDETLGLVQDKQHEIEIQQGIVEGLEGAVQASCSAVVKARQELRGLELKVKSDEAKSKATTVSENAAKVIEAARSIGVTGGALQQESDAVHEQYEQARAKLEDAQGTPAEREFKSRKRQEELTALRKRLDEQRTLRDSAAK
ncbi:MAG TPA: hypothetical protein V6C81_10835 [Planktothrix sp.]|jgi:hypothetical protein